jgi:hypothetical protein
MLDTLTAACPVAGTSNTPATAVATIGGQILEIVAGGWGDGGGGAFARGAVAVRTRHHLTVLAITADSGSHAPLTHKGLRFEVQQTVEDLSERSCGVALNHAMYMECAVLLESGTLLCVGDAIMSHPTPTAWDSGAMGSGAAIGCEYAHHPREVCVHRSTGLGLWDLRSPAASCWRPLWDVGAEVRARCTHTHTHTLSCHNTRESTVPPAPLSLLPSHNSTRCCVLTRAQSFIKSRSFFIALHQQTHCSQPFRL